MIFGKTHVSIFLNYIFFILRIELWSNCGVKIKNVQHEDGGLWRLISKEKNKQIEGLFSVFVKGKIFFHQICDRFDKTIT